MTISTPTNALSDTKTAVPIVFLHHLTVRLFRLSCVRYVFYIKSICCYTISCSVWQCVFSSPNLVCLFGYWYTETYFYHLIFCFLFFPTFSYAVIFFLHSSSSSFLTLNDGDILVVLVFLIPLTIPTHHGFISSVPPLFFPILLELKLDRLACTAPVAATWPHCPPQQNRFQNTLILITSLLTYVMSLSDI